LTQLAMIREKAIRAYKQGLSGGSKDMTEFEAMLKVSGF
jgi:ribosome modulation factor